MKIRKEPSEVWAEYQRGINYNQSIGLYDTVKQNNNFYNDKQWEGVNAPDLDKPVFNFLKPVVSYYVAMLISDDVAVNVELGNSVRPPAEAMPGMEMPVDLNTDDDEHSLVWADEAAGIAFCLEATEDEETMLRVAEAVSVAK